MFEKNKKQEKNPRKTSVYVVDTYYERQKLLNLITKKVYGICKRYILRSFVIE